MLTPEQKKWLQYEIRSFILTFGAFFIVEAGSPLMALYNGDYSEAVWMALLAAVVRSSGKAFLTLLFPQLFKKP